MSFPRYETYKPSGIEWLASTPAHWTAVPLRGVARAGRATFIDGDWIESPFITDEGIRLIQTGNIGTGGYREQGYRYISEATFSALNCTQVHPGDVLICRLAEPVGRACLAPDLGVAMITSVDVCILKPGPSVDGRFVVYLLSCPDYLGYMESECRGGTRDRVSRSFLGAVRICLPPLSEQFAIVNFLDHETAKIDGLIARQERLIALLKEKRQAVISHTVTKGLDPNAPMKDSGVEWLGQVPAHWGIDRVKYIVRTIEQGWSPQCDGFAVESEQEWGVLKVGCVNGGVFDPRENKSLPTDLDPIPALAILAGDLLVSRANTRELVGSAAVASEDYPNLMLCDKLYRLRLCTDACLPEFLSYYFGASAPRGQIELSATGASSSMLNISQSGILEMPAPIPTLSEQTAIVTFLRNETAQLDSLTVEAASAIALLQERRAALISAAVTGKIDVRGLALVAAEAA